MRRKKRAHRCAEETSELLARARARGLTSRELAEELGVHPNTVGNWIRRERASTRDQLPLLPVRVVAPDAARESSRDPADRGIEVLVDDVVLRLPPSVDAGDLRTVLSVLGEGRC